jgi:hypothetical protein
MRHFLFLMIVAPVLCLHIGRDHDTPMNVRSLVDGETFNCDCLTNQTDVRGGVVLNPYLTPWNTQYYFDHELKDWQTYIVVIPAEERDLCKCSTVHYENPASPKVMTVMTLECQTFLI